MPTISIELSFDHVAETRIADLWGTLGSTFAKRGGSQLGLRPHVSLAVFRGAVPARLSHVLESFAAAQVAFPIRFVRIGSFPTDEGVLFLEPDDSSVLRNAHQMIADLLGPDASLVHPYYRPDRWRPHCTIATGVPKSDLHAVTETCESRGYPQTVSACRVSVVQYRPLEELRSLALGEQGRSN